MGKSIWLPLCVLLFLLPAVGCSRSQESEPNSSRTAAPPVEHTDAPSAELGEVDPKLSKGATLGPQEISALVALGALAFILLLLFLHKRRALLLESPHLVTPENFRAWTRDVERAIGSSQAEVSEMKEMAARTHDRLFVQFDELQKTFLTLRQALDIRDQQLQRAEDGWEMHVFKRFLTRFCRIDAMLNDGDAPDSQSLLSDVRAMLDDALAECGVQKIHPKLGADFRTENVIGDQPALDRIEDPTFHYTVKRVISPAYVADTPNGQLFVVVPARVEIYAPLENSQ